MGAVFLYPCLFMLVKNIGTAFFRVCPMVITILRTLMIIVLFQIVMGLD